MTRNVTTGLSIKSFRASRLRSQSLIGTVNTKASPADAVAWMGAIQAQDFNMAKWAVGIRTPDSTEQTVLEAFNRGDFLRTHVLRPTWHFVAAQDIRWMCELSRKRIKTALRTHDQTMGITEELRNKANALFVDALKGGRHLPAKELALILEAAGIDTTENRLYHYLMHAESDALICSGKIQGSTQTYALLEERVAPAAPAVAPIQPEASIIKLTIKYLQSHAPATIEDFVWWSGLSKTKAQSGLTALGDAVQKTEFAGQEYYSLQQEDADYLQTQPKSGALLLSAFDEYIIAYCNRDAVIAKEHQPKAFTSNGVFRPTIVSQGNVIGTWRKGPKPKQPIELSYFSPLSQTAQNQVAKAIRKYQAFY